MGESLNLRDRRNEPGPESDVRPGPGPSERADYVVEWQLEPSAFGSASLSA